MEEFHDIHIEREFSSAIQRGELFVSEEAEIRANLFTIDLLNVSGPLKDKLEPIYTALHVISLAHFELFNQVSDYQTAFSATRAQTWLRNAMRNPMVTDQERQVYSKISDKPLQLNRNSQASVADFKAELGFRLLYTLLCNGILTDARRCPSVDLDFQSLDDYHLRYVSMPVMSNALAKH
jgi:hypothetical protein